MGGAYGTTLLTGLVLWDDGTEELTGRASLWDFSLRGGGTYGTSLLPGRRRLRDESLRDV